MRGAAAIAAGVLLAYGSAAPAQHEIVQPLPDGYRAAGEQDAGFRAYLDTVAARARREGVSEATIRSVLPSLSYDADVVMWDRRLGPAPSSSGGAGTNAGFPSFGPEIAKRINAQKISQGRAVYAAEADHLGRIERETGVPGSILIAIFGHETNYGTILGRSDLPRSLATLAYEGRRRQLFEGELIAVLKMIDQGVPRTVLKGSYAGAFGYPQFLPSVYLKLARDGDGDGRAEIWSSRADAFASIGNYLDSVGWQGGVPWGFAVQVPAGLDLTAIANRERVAKCQRAVDRHSVFKTMREWRRLGVAPLDGRWPDDDVEASLLVTPGLAAPAYLLTRNYRAILDYNCSNYYAVSVGLLGDAIRQ